MSSSLLECPLSTLLNEGGRVFPVEVVAATAPGPVEANQVPELVRQEAQRLQMETAQAQHEAHDVAWVNVLMAQAGGQEVLNPGPTKSRIADSYPIGGRPSGRVRDNAAEQALMDCRRHNIAAAAELAVAYVAAQGKGERAEARLQALVRKVHNDDRAFVRNHLGEVSLIRSTSQM
jgi:hypothetical protein